MLLFELLADLIIAGNKNRLWDQWMCISIIDVIIMFTHRGKPPIEWSDRFSTTAVSIVNHKWMFKNLFFIFDPLILISSPTCSFFRSNNIFCLFHLEPNRLLDHFPRLILPHGWSEIHFENIDHFPIHIKTLKTLTIWVLHSNDTKVSHTNNKSYPSYVLRYGQSKVPIEESHKHSCKAQNT